jgi:hypothetical protein
MEVGHGQEKSEEGKEGGKEEEESGRPKGGGEASQEDRQEGRRQEGRRPKGIGAQESGRSEAPAAARDADGGTPGARDRDCSTGSFDGGDAGGENGAEPCRGLAVPDGVEALNAPRMNCGRSGAPRLRAAPQTFDRQTKSRGRRSFKVGKHLITLKQLPIDPL